uniref:NADH dehydrogenase subunit 5 n=1 Tax=Trypanosoma vivax TaxID=5699 RepID=A0A0E3J9R4_TRYVI|nr:NADH dehydrogenase subunit 5 [Trypanosoma vivax]AJO53303.1 NADH dehydrogenase subunit 5 [Trypanosoma vivax]
MFLFIYIFFIIFSFISGILVLGRHILSFWLALIIPILILMLIFFSFFVISVCLYGYIYFDFCLILLLDFSHIYLSFCCTGFYLFILLLINIVFCFIIFYAFYYMYYDILLWRFMLIFWIFVLSMNIFILSFDFLTAYCGWELLCLFSFQLISYFWFRFFALKYGFKAFLIGKIGDVLLIISYSVCFFSNGYSMITFQYINFFCVDYYYIQFIIGLLIICAFTKSTQFGLHIWLPDAMEGPIPVSALIHAATLVVCGIILLSFTYWCFDFWFSYYYYIIGWSSLILVLMSICVMFNFDAKRYVAYSTICQISFSMFCCLCVDLYVGCLFFCYHMFYKATLFIVLGVWIHIYFGLQDIRCFFFMYFCGCILARILLIFAILNSCSMWFLCGFYCKDLLLASLLLISFYNVIEILFICIFFIFVTIIYNYFLLFFLMFVFKCFCLVDCLFLLFDFECCLIYCFCSLYMCFISIFLVMDFLFYFIFSSYCVFWLFLLNFYNFFDLAIVVIFLILLSAFIYFGYFFILFYNIDCIMLFWRVIIIIIMIFVFSLFCCWYFVCTICYAAIFVWNFVIYWRYNLKYCLFFCILWYIYI